LALTSALASQIKRDGTSYDFLGVVDHADYESDISFLIRPSGGPVWFTCATFWVYEIPWDKGDDSCRSQRELPEYTKITSHCSEKSVTFMGSKIVFFYFST
jgi:hypothetical protein